MLKLRRDESDGLEGSRRRAVILHFETTMLHKSGMPRKISLLPMTTSKQGDVDNRFIRTTLPANTWTNWKVLPHTKACDSMKPSNGEMWGRQRLSANIFPKRKCWPSTIGEQTTKPTKPGVYHRQGGPARLQSGTSLSLPPLPPRA